MAEPTTAEVATYLRRLASAGREVADYPGSKMFDAAADHLDRLPDVEFQRDNAIEEWNRLISANARHIAERNEARALAVEALRKCKDLLLEASNLRNKLTCAFCGHEYPPGTPPSQHEALTEHVMQCGDHPLRALLDAFGAAWDSARSYALACAAVVQPEDAARKISLKLEALDPRAKGGCS